MTELKRTFTADYLESIGAVRSGGKAKLLDEWDNEHRHFDLWRVVFRDPADDTTWQYMRAVDKTEMGEIPWWYVYDERGEIIGERVEPRAVTRTEWFLVTTDTDSTETGAMVMS